MCSVSPCPVSFEEGRVVNDGGEQGREAPQQQGGEELSDDGVLRWSTEGRFRRGLSSRSLSSVLGLPAPSPSKPQAPWLLGPCGRNPEHCRARARVGAGIMNTTAGGVTVMVSIG